MNKSEVQTATKTSLQTRLSLGFMLATCLLTVGIFIVSGAYALIINYSDKTTPVNINQTSDLTNINSRLNNNAGITEDNDTDVNRQNTDLEFNTEI